MPVKVEGLQRCLTAFQKTREGDSGNIAIGIQKALAVIGRKADYYCPVEYGDLRASKKEEVTGKGFGAKGIITYTAPYAIPVHENLDATHAEPTCAKWLERAARETKGTQTSILHRQVKFGKT